MLGHSSLSSTTKESPVRRSTDEIYRHYRLIAGQRGDGYSAVAYAGKVRVFSGSGSDLDGALDDLKAQIDSDFDRRAGQRGGDLPSIEEFELAFALAAGKITGPLQHLMEALRDGPAISPELVQRRSGADRETLLCDLVRLARALADILAIPLPKGTGNAHTALELVAERITFDSDGEGFWKFRSAFAAAAKAHLDR